MRLPAADQVDSPKEETGIRCHRQATACEIFDRILRWTQIRMALGDCQYRVLMAPEDRQRLLVVSHIVSSALRGSQLIGIRL